MRRLALIASVALAPGWVGAQSVPARDLLEFPAGTLAEPTALVRSVAGGFWNPASPALEAARTRASVAAFNTPVEQAVTIYTAGAAFRLRPALTGAVSAVRAQVADVVRTTTDPNTQDPSAPGDEIPYHTSVLSGGVSASLRKGVTLGGALRYRRGTADADRRQSVSLDGGFVLHRVGGLPLRLAASSFLFGRGERTSLHAAAEYAVLTDSVRDFRAAYSFTGTQESGYEHYVMGVAKYGRLEARAGMVNVINRLQRAQRLRLGIGLYYARYTVGIAREENGAGLGPSYQFALTSSYK